MNTLFKTVTSSQDQKSVVPFQQFIDIEHKIIIEELEVQMFIGLLPEEKKHKQRVLINIEVDIDPKESYDENIENTICYASIIKDVESLAASQHFDLVETFTTKIMNHCIRDPRVNKVKASVLKPDIIKNTKTVGFSIVRIKQK